MSSPGSDGSKTNSFEDAENGNVADGSSGAQATYGKASDKASADQGAVGSTGAGITLSEDDISFLISKSKQPENPTEASDTQPKQPPSPPVRRSPDGGAGASSTGDQGASHPRSPPLSDSTRSSSTEVSPSARGDSTVQNPKPRSRSVYEDNPPPLAPGLKSQGSGYGDRAPEPVMAVGVTTEDIDTASLAQAGDPETAQRGGISDSLCCWFCEHFAACRYCCQLSRCSELVNGTKAVITITAMFGLAFLLIFSKYLLHPYVDHKIREALTLRPGFEKWRKPGAKIVADVYLFNLSNPKQFMEEAQIPILNQVGPYSFRINVEKIDISWNDNGTVSYRERYTFKFDESMSNGSENDQITTANLPLLIMDDYMGASSVLFNGFLSKKDRQLVESHTVRELIWGYHSPVFDEAKKIASWAPFRFFHHAEEIPSMMEALPQDNTSLSRIYNVYTGADDFSKINDIFSWDYQRKLPYWSTEEANKIKGTDGSSFKPFLKEDSKVSVFFAQLFRSFHLEFQWSHSLRGLRAFRYTIPDSQFSNSTRPHESDDSFLEQPTLTENQALTIMPSKSALISSPVSIAPTPFGDSFAEDYEKSEGDSFGVSPDESYDEARSHKSGYCVPDCVPNGAYSIEPCTAAPLYISLPHFLGADQFYLSQVFGLRPQEDKHRPTFDIDSITGVIISTSRRYQLNVRVNAGKSGDTFLPVLWVDLRADLDEGTVDRLRLASHAKLAVAIIIFCIIGVIALLFSITCGLILYSCCADTERSRFQPLLPRPDQRLL